MSSLAVVQRSPVFPTEILEQICLFLPPNQGFRVAIGLRLIRVRNRLLPVVNTSHSKKWYFRRMDTASERGDVDLLQAWLDSGAQLQYTTASIDRASLKGKLNVLSWWQASGLELQYTQQAFMLAHGNPFKHEKLIEDEADMITVLNWWRESGLPMLNKEAMNTASQHGLIRVLDWWKDESGKEPVYSPFAFHTCHIDSLKWWKQSGLPMLCDRTGLRYTLSYPLCLTKRLNLLEWWRKESTVSFAAEDGDHASEVNNLDVLNWLKESGELLYTEKAMDCAGSTEVLQWWINNIEIINLKYSEKAIFQCNGSNGRNCWRRMVSRLEWWKSCGLPPKWTDEEFAAAMEEAMKEEELGVDYRIPGRVHPHWDTDRSSESGSDEDGNTGSDAGESTEGGSDSSEQAADDEADADQVDNGEVRQGL
ncbi:hypothetical protein HDU89_001559 [Geranomyces variabilis]|nr:hypothetical protein HDU89_001559 [Geranomyces variabilis]